uniref:Uncharacterized protein n=1 Tax=Romanomermis culicivorax TaxID=13658 RepID=A0A915JFR0_ROMCU
MHPLDASRDPTLINGSSLWDKDTNSNWNFSLHGNHTHHYRYDISSDLWKIILVGSLIAIAVLALVVLVLIWRFCSKRPDDEANIRSSAAKLDDAAPLKKCCCCCLSKFTRPQSTAAPPVIDLPTNATTTPAITTKNKVINQPQLLMDGENFDPGYSKVPLPPITASPNEYRFTNQFFGDFVPNPLFSASSVTPLPPTPPGRRALPHGRLAPLFLDQKHASEPIARFITSNLNGQQQTFSVKGVPEIKVSAGKQRSLPTPPPLG